MRGASKGFVTVAVLFMGMVNGACRTKDDGDTGGLDTGAWLGTGECHIPAEGIVQVNSFCSYTPPPGQFDFETEWSMATFANYPAHKKSYSSPMVGQLSDDNLDGVIDEWDTPDIVAVFDDRQDMRGVLRVISGDGSKSWSDTYDQVWNGWTWYPYRYATPALGDVDGDSLPDIALTVTDDTHCYPALYDRHGQLQWVYVSEPLECRSHSPALADLNADGDPEMIFGHLILDAASGNLVGRGQGGSGYNNDYFNSGYQSVPIDLDGDGVQEVLAGSHIYDRLGNTICETGYPDGYPSPADLDGDGVGEFVVTGNEYVRLFEADCSLIAEWETAGYGYGGPSTVADFDGDGEPEITVADKSRFTLYEVDGSIVWSLEIDETSSGATASSVFDFDGDGAAEVVYGDELALWVLDGKSGTVMLEDTNHTSGTVHEYPIIVDVDGDGSTEILVTNSDARSGLYVIGEKNNAWVSARFLWNQHAYNITNIDSNLGVPRNPAPNWPEFNSFRQGGPGTMMAQGASDLYPIEGDVCQERCGTTVYIVTQAANGGLLRAGGQTRIGLFGVEEDGNWEMISASPFVNPLGSGRTTSGRVFQVESDVVAKYTDIIVWVDDEGISNECDESDNRYTVDLSLVCLEAEDTAADSGDTGGSDTGGSDTGGSDTGSSDTGSSDTGDTGGEEATEATTTEELSGDDAFQRALLATERRWFERLELQCESDAAPLY